MSIRNHKVHKSKCRLFLDDGWVSEMSGLPQIQMTEIWPYLRNICLRYRQH